ncbi:Uncharacterised protein [Mycoplasmopsis californica]|uniref:Uncharacterized protein n=1 Tax=Mycoplasmopsis equigenitalium TaxID=114883 RepID=A0ABY5J1B4_9BACT|nr:hypothetical protein [Mycoplasmopsis equigenitalium]UUD37034.1 hypothetical protein NPA09_00450 [Mycoplasmopsis equigenitalium]VEU69666.1 Uncharacterised protein [Mycoplasmopsis californica]
MQNTNSFKTVINFLLSKKVEFPNSEVYVNIGDEDDWIRLTNDSILSYEIVLLKIYDLNEKTQKFFFGKNVNVIVENNEIKINTFSDHISFKAVKIKNLYSNEMKEINKKISQLEALQHLGIDLDTYLELKKLKQEQYILKMKNLFKLREER